MTTTKPLKRRNQITTAGYFIKRLRDNRFVCLKVFNDYGDHDPRKWTILVDPGGSSVYITCWVNSDFFGEKMFELNGIGFKNFNLKTESIEIIIQELLNRGVSNNAQETKYFKPVTK